MAEAAGSSAAAAETSAGAGASSPASPPAPSPLSAVSASEAFHQRQRLMHCGVHACNNLLQEAVFSAADFDAIAAGLPGADAGWFNPYRTRWLGNFDASVLMVALAERGIELRQHDRRKRATTIDFEQPGLVGCIVNQRSNSWSKAVLRRVGLLDSRHWVAVLALDAADVDTPPGALAERFLLIDSKHKSPQPFNVAVLREYLQGVLDAGGEVFLAFNNSTQPQQTAQG